MLYKSCIFLCIFKPTCVCKFIEKLYELLLRIELRIIIHGQNFLFISTEERYSFFTDIFNTLALSFKIGNFLLLICSIAVRKHIQILMPQSWNRVKTWARPWIWSRSNCNGNKSTMIHLISSFIHSKSFVCAIKPRGRHWFQTIVFANNCWSGNIF